MEYQTSSNFEFRDIFSILKRRIWLIIVPFLLATITVIIGVRFITPKYQSSVILAIDRQVTLSREMREILSTDANFRRQDRRRGELEGIYNHLTSKKYIAMVAERLGLDKDPDILQQSQAIALTQPQETAENIALQLLQNDLMGRIELVFAADDQIRIQVESVRPAEARDIANTLGEIFIEERLKQERQNIRTPNDFVDIEFEEQELLLEGLKKEKTNMEMELLKTQLDEGVTSEENRSEISAEIDRANTNIANYKKSESETIAKLEKLGVIQNSLPANNWGNKIVARKELHEQLRKVGSMMIKYRWSDPQILNAKIRLNTVLANMEDENSLWVKDHFSELDIEQQNLIVNLLNTGDNLDYFQQKTNNLKQELDDINNRMSTELQDRARLNRITRDVDLATQDWELFQRTQDKSLMREIWLDMIAAQRHRIVEPASLALSPHSPDKLRIIMIGIVLGLVLGGVAVFIAEIADSSLRDVDQVEEYLQIPVIGIMPKVQHLKKLQLGN